MTDSLCTFMLKKIGKMKKLLIVTLILIPSLANSQPDRWQQQVDYTMEIDLDDITHQFKGIQKIIYTNNSPDTLTHIYYHLYFNAFKPGSMMDIRSRTIKDPDNRVRERIFNLKTNEIGFLKVRSLKDETGKNLDHKTEKSDETILEVALHTPILPNTTTEFSMEFDGQVPLQIRRSGRDNAEGISYSMAQWYPKLAEYDYEGWHTNPYIGREFYGVWGNFDVTLKLDAKYVVAATGVLQNPEETGHGYEKSELKVKRPKGKLEWHFKADNVHDFVWAADPDYIHDVVQTDFGLELHFFYQNDTSIIKNWKQLPAYTEKAFRFMNENFGKYPYSEFSVIQGGDGGMEYPMATLIRGNGNLRGLVGVTVHELIHSWYYGVLGTNESLYPWMDEGFTSFASSVVSNYLFQRDVEANPVARQHSAYFSLVESGKEEPMTTHSDHFNENRSYSTSAYSKGATALGQLNYIMGREVFMKAMRRYYNTWKFRHPNLTDFKRVMEKESGLELDWFFEYFIYSTKTIDYAIRTVVAPTNMETEIRIDRIGHMPMPLDILVEYKDGSQEFYYIPMVLMRGEKKPEETTVPRTVLDDWAWTDPVYTFLVATNGRQIQSVEIDPSQRMADIDRSNNRIEINYKMSETIENEK